MTHDIKVLNRLFFDYHTVLNQMDLQSSVAVPFKFANVFFLKTHKGIFMRNETSDKQPYIYLYIYFNVGM